MKYKIKFSRQGAWLFVRISGKLSLMNWWSKKEIIDPPRQIVERTVINKFMVLDCTIFVFFLYKKEYQFLNLKVFFFKNLFIWDKLKKF